jgi:DNA polymerase-2
VRTFNIDPLTYVKDPSPTDDLITAPNGARFRREPGILPGMLDRFFASRERAKAEGDEVASAAYKIIMNSFYGVLATEASRFSSPSIAGAITSFGQHVLRWTQDLLEAEGLRVRYGDTDSLFVDAGLEKDISAEEAHRRGTEIAAFINQRLAEYVRSTYEVESRLEIEFEKHYRRFFLPTARGSSERGRAKGYAGLRLDAGAGGEALEIVGMEAVRRDWTPLAQEFQRELLTRVFHDASVEEIKTYIACVVDAVRSGCMDDKLIYRKALRKPVEDYTKTRPPHVQAASLLPRPSGVIRYLMTTAGPQPEGHLNAPIDYKHYIKKQLKPIAESITDIVCIDLGGTPLGDGQLRLF